MVVALKIFLSSLSRGASLSRGEVLLRLSSEQGSAIKKTMFGDRYSHQSTVSKRNVAAIVASNSMLPENIA